MFRQDSLDNQPRLNSQSLIELNGVKIIFAFFPLKRNFVFSASAPPASLELAIAGWFYVQIIMNSLVIKNSGFDYHCDPVGLDGAVSSRSRF